MGLPTPDASLGREVSLDSREKREDFDDDPINAPKFRRDDPRHHRGRGNSFSSVNNLPVESPDVDQESQSPQPDNRLRPLKTNEIKKMIKENIKKRSQTFTSSEESSSPASHREFKNKKINKGESKYEKQYVPDMFLCDFC
jgi:hypothetical protein